MAITKESNLETLFFKNIYDNILLYIDDVHSSFFNNEELSFMFSVLKKNILDNYDVYKKPGNLPIPKRAFFEMLKVEKSDNVTITKEIVKSVLENVNLEQYGIDFINEKQKLWLAKNKVEFTFQNTLDQFREINELDTYEDVKLHIDLINEKIKDMSHLSCDVDVKEMGSDFYNAESHNQDSSIFKIKTGDETLDEMMDGGFDAGTLNILIAETNAGKSLWLQNFASRYVENGINVLYVTLEMSERKVLKRLGSMILKIPIKEYDKLSVNQSYMKTKIDEFRYGKVRASGFTLNDCAEPPKRGELVVKYWPSGVISVDNIKDYLKKSNIKFGVIICDYMQLFKVNLKESENLYMKGKVISEGLRAIPNEYDDCIIISALQVDKASWGSGTMAISSVAESKAYAETADSLYAIIRPEELKKQNKYLFKKLKQRDGNFDINVIKCDLDVTHLNITNFCKLEDGEEQEIIDNAKKNKNK